MLNVIVELIVVSRKEFSKCKFSSTCVFSRSLYLTVYEVVSFFL